MLFPKKSKLLNLPQNFLYSVKGKSAIPEITKRGEKMKVSIIYIIEITLDFAIPGIHSMDCINCFLHLHIIQHCERIEPRVHFISSLNMIVDLIDQLD